MTTTSQVRIKLTTCSVLCFGILVTAAAARADQRDDVTAARMAWAERRVQLVCEPLREMGDRRRADLCIAETTRVSDEARSGIAATGSLSAVALQQPMPARISGLAVLRRFSSLGVGF